MKSKHAIQAILNAIKARTGYLHLDLKSAVRYLCDCYHGSVGTDTVAEYDTSEDFDTVNTLKSALNLANRTTGKNHTNITDAVRTLLNGYAKETPLYSFGAVSDIHIQYATGYTDFQRALSYFEKQNMPFVTVCGDLTWAAKMVNGEASSAEYIGGLADYKAIVGSRSNIYPIGGNHECYTATYNTSTQTWSSVDNGFDAAWWKENTGCDPFYTISSNPTNASTHNVYNASIPSGDVFIMLSVKTGSAPHLFFTSADGEDQMVWLQNTLETNRNKRCFVFMHLHDNLDKTADPYAAYPHGIFESTSQGKAFIDLMRAYPNVIWFHGHTHNSFYEEMPSVGTSTARGYKTVNIPSLQGSRDFNEDGTFATYSDGSEAYIVEVYENYLVLKGLELKPVKQDGTGTATVVETYVLDTTKET